jgi:hypothetical protein
LSSFVPCNEQHGSAWFALADSIIVINGFAILALSLVAYRNCDEKKRNKNCTVAKNNNKRNTYAFEHRSLIYCSLYTGVVHGVQTRAHHQTQDFDFKSFVLFGIIRNMTANVRSWCAVFGTMCMLARGVEAFLPARNAHPTGTTLLRFGGSYLDSLSSASPPQSTPPTMTTNPSLNGQVGGGSDSFLVGILGDLHIDPRKMEDYISGKEHWDKIFTEAGASGLNTALVSLGDLGKQKDPWVAVEGSLYFWKR